VRRAAGQQHLPPHAVRALVVAGGRAVADVLLRGVPEDGCIRCARLRCGLGTACLCAACYPSLPRVAQGALGVCAPCA
jgi:hypothetical protein